MPFYQCDANGLVKRYVSEIGSDWVRAIVEPTAANSISIADITRAEETNAFARRAREGVITLNKRNKLIQTFRVTAPRNIALSRLSQGSLTGPLHLFNVIHCGLTMRYSRLPPVLSSNR